MIVLASGDLRANRFHALRSKIPKPLFVHHHIYLSFKA
jgi:hypothetical protein